jgi:hypothetical protein
MTVVLGILVLVAAFTAGVLTGRTIAVRLAVDKHIAREMRFRAPATNTSAPGMPPSRAADVPMVGGVPVNPWDFMPPAESYSGLRGMTVEDAMCGASRLSALMAGEPRCAKPVRVDVGPARIEVTCMLQPHHDGRCS